MAKPRGAGPAQTNRMENYTVPLGQATRDEAHVDAEPTPLKIMAAIKDVKDSLEPKIDSVSVEVTLIRADLSRLNEVATAETDIGELQTTTKRLEEQVRSLTQQTSIMEARLEDQEGRARRNNVRILGVPEGAER